MSNNVGQQQVTCNGETFTKGTYNGIAVLKRNKDGFINATDMCKQFNKRYAKINENHSWQAYFEEFKREYTTLPEMGGFIYVLNSGVTKDLRGTYVDPRLINYIAIWASPQYAITVCKIMDGINEKVHEVLIENKLPDTVENAKPIFNSVANSIAHDIGTKNVEAQCWGVRDSGYRMDPYERKELADLICEIKKSQEQMNILTNKLSEYPKTWIQQIDST